MNTTKLYSKLHNAKKHIGKISKDSTNPFYNSKYFDINTLLSQVEPILEDNGLMILQPIEKNSVCTQIIDVESGEKIQSCIELPTLTDPQKLGSAITYYRRYTLQSILSLQAEDDDGNKASNLSRNNSNDKTTIDIWLNNDQFNKVKLLPKKQIKECLQKYNGQTFGDGKTYGMKKTFRTELTNLIK